MALCHSHLNVSSQGSLQSVSPCIQSIMCSAWGHTPFCAYCVAKRDLKCERRDYKLELWNPFFFRSDAVNGTRVSSSARRSDSRELEQHKVHYRWVMFRHRCLSQRVPWHFGQLEDSLWFLFVIRIKKGSPNQSCASSSKTTLFTSILCRKGSKCL